MYFYFGIYIVNNIFIYICINFYPIYFLNKLYLDNLFSKFPFPDPTSIKSYLYTLEIPSQICFILVII